MNKNIYCFNCAKKYKKMYEKYFKCDYNINYMNLDNMFKDKINYIREDLLIDYLRLSIIYQKGGLLLDGNFIIVSDLSILLNNDFFIGYETENKISTRVIWAKEKNNKYIGSILKKIEEVSKIKEKSDYSITYIASEALGKNLNDKINSMVKLDEASYIYSYDYFFPLDYENHGKIFSESTKMIYYDIFKKLSTKNKIKLKIFMRIGPLAIVYIQNILDKLRFKLASKKYKLKQKLHIYKKHSNECIINAICTLDKINLKKDDYIIFHNPNWLGVTSATKELFTNLIPIEEIYDKSYSLKLARKINEVGVKQVIFSAFADGWELLAEDIKKINKNIQIKVFWHGSNSQVIDSINWRTNVKALELHKKNIIDVFATCKESIVNFYKSQGYKTIFIKNTVRLDDNLKENILNNKKKNLLNKKNEDILKIGIYSANMNWRKNMFNQIAAASLIKNSQICSLPLNFEGQVFSSRINEKIEGELRSVAREELLNKMSENDINLYVTFSECAPMLPIESMEVGTLCITGNNHHYFKDSLLEEYLVVDREDDVIEISEKINNALKNKDKIFDLYKKWKIDYDIESQKSVKDFLKI